MELLLVVTLLAILASVAVVGHAALRPTLELRRASRQIVMELKQARLRAIADHVSHRILFADGVEGSYQRQRREGGTYVNDGGPVPLPPGIRVVQCTARDRGISFRARGTADSFGSVIVRNGSGEERRIVVDIAGHIRVQ